MITNQLNWQVLCNHTGFIGPWIISAIISDGVQDIYATWYVSYEVWHPPEPVTPEEEKAENSVLDFDVTTNQMIFLGLGVLINTISNARIGSKESLQKHNSSQCLLIQSMNQATIRNSSRCTIASSSTGCIQQMVVIRALSTLYRLQFDTSSAVVV